MMYLLPLSEQGRGPICRSAQSIRSLEQVQDAAMSLDDQIFVLFAGIGHSAVPVL